MQLIFTADDFGRSPAVNAAVELAHRQGVLTAASLMVAEPAWAEAVALARTLPDLAVGLHVVVGGGRAVLPPKDIPHLVDARGRFPPDGLTAGLRYAFSAVARRELVQELTAQFERFAATGLPLSHVDGHMHLHMLPGVLATVVRLAIQFGAAGLRVPHDVLWLSWRHERRAALAKLGWTLAFTGLRQALRRHWQGTSLRVADRVFGVLQSGHMDEAYVLRVLDYLTTPAATRAIGVAEFYFHPALEPGGEDLGPNPGDLATLLSPRLREALAAGGLQPTSYLVLRRQQRASPG
jgi:hopanoid biosynthesis associated protein HpnK